MSQPRRSLRTGDPAVMAVPHGAPRTRPIVFISDFSLLHRPWVLNLDGTPTAFVSITPAPKTSARPLHPLTATVVTLTGGHFHREQV
jgi:hypothetical protein